jgi:hypothetical protein
MRASAWTAAGIAVSTFLSHSLHRPTSTARKDGVPTTASTGDETDSQDLGLPPSGDRYSLYSSTVESQREEEKADRLTVDSPLEVANQGFCSQPTEGLPRSRNSRLLHGLPEPNDEASVSIGSRSTSSKSLHDAENGWSKMQSRVWAMGGLLLGGGAFAYHKRKKERDEQERKDMEGFAKAMREYRQSRNRIPNKREKVLPVSSMNGARRPYTSSKIFLGTIFLFLCRKIRIPQKNLLRPLKTIDLTAISIIMHCIPSIVPTGGTLETVEQGKILTV